MKQFIHNHNGCNGRVVSGKCEKCERTPPGSEIEKYHPNKSEVVDLGRAVQPTVREQRMVSISAITTLEPPPIRKSRAVYCGGVFYVR